MLRFILPVSAHVGQSSSSLCGATIGGDVTSARKDSLGMHLLGQVGWTRLGWLILSSRSSLVCRNHRRRPFVTCCNVTCSHTKVVLVAHAFLRDTRYYARSMRERVHAHFRRRSFAPVHGLVRAREVEGDACASEIVRHRRHQLHG
mmetsp:Transcript_9182/g.55740  ORF Transcript_9182/g.55740 Transcript_9182/m.55740 type:complete len:146 (+) Transcript_9182:883-1320(+)